jgi:hypothetical protein
MSDGSLPASWPPAWLMQPRDPRRDREQALRDALKRLAGNYQIDLTKPDGPADLLAAFIEEAPAVSCPMRRRPGKPTKIKKPRSLFTVVEAIRTGNQHKIEDQTLRTLAQAISKHSKQSVEAICAALAVHPLSPWNGQNPISLRNTYNRVRIAARAMAKDIKRGTKALRDTGHKT